MKIQPYLSFDGNCLAAFEFYEKALGGKIAFKMTYGDSPMAGQFSADMHSRILHISIEVKGQSFMGADAPKEHASKPQGFCVSLSVGETAEADKVFAALSENGKIQMPIAETFWAQRFGMVIDQFGIPWMVSCEKPMNG